MNKKIFLAIPTYKYIEPDTQQCLSKLFTRFAGQIHYCNRRGSPNIYLQHSGMCEEFLQTDCDYYLWFDSDQVMLEDDWLDKLIAANKPIISPLIVKKMHPYYPACITQRQHDAVMKGEKMPVEDYRRYGERPFKVLYSCGGVVLIKREVLETIKNPFYPSFDERGVMMGVDISLYYKANKEGFQCWIEPSIKCGHLGMFAFLPQDYYSLIDAGIIDGEHMRS